MVSLYGDNERLVGDWFRRTGKRNEIFFASKFGFVKGSKTLEIDSSGEYCKKACEESLKILGIDYIDLCKVVISPRRSVMLTAVCVEDYVHHVNPKTPIEETMRAMLELKQYLAL